MTERIGSVACNCDPEGSYGIDCNEVGLYSLFQGRVHNSSIDSMSDS